METVHDTDAVLEAIAPTGIRATVGKCLMDDGGDAGPAARAVARRHRRQRRPAPPLARPGGRPDPDRAGARFAVSCSRTLLEAVAAESAASGILVHTHASENRDEVAFVRAKTGLGNMAYLAQLGLAFAAAVRGPLRVGRRRRAGAIMAERGVQVLHCPGSNLKLGSGVAPIVALRAQGIGVSLGADAACNNRLDMFDEMRLAATLQAERHGPGSLTARDVLLMATRAAPRRSASTPRSARSRRASGPTSSWSGRRAAPRPGHRSVVHAGSTARGTDVAMTMVDGRILVEDGVPIGLDAGAVLAESRAAARTLMSRQACYNRLAVLG